ncbi:hypothetical protein L6270_03535 [Candidatus Parcubacteria bacterium]|nr:hypothetical protein [Patescibacteria group bacterium]MBU4309036.1 hypothetical protein [Patescibacteria group bacterium]MBU4431965.1 hypothetical protein [Patescibacteria group bacterium]MBU4577397.1 hypothetical protein [Patescibacteria group bacterium]MCG2697085.1 hypothetical protein [Candidatus Parcubacteria bacterium]
MKTLVKCLVVLLAPVLLGACAAKNTMYLPKYAITDPGNAISIPHPIEMQKKEVKSVTIWTGVLSPDLLVEVISGNGVFPIIGSDGKKEFYGFAYLVDLNYWGEWIGQFEIQCSESEAKSAKFVLVNRDGGFAYSLMGERITTVDKSDPQKNINPYDVEKFDTDLEVRSRFLTEFGMTFSEVNTSWQKFFYAKGINFGNRSVVTEYAIGSSDWLKMVDKVNQDIESGKLTAYKVGGEIRIGRMNFDQFADKASDVPDFKIGDRIIKRAAVPVVSLASMAIGPLAMAGAGFGGTVYSANIDNDWHGHTLRSKFWGYELAPTFRSVCEQYKKLLIGRDEEIRRLKHPTQLSRR